MTRIITLADMSRFMSRFVIFSKCKNPIFQIQRFSRVGPTLGGGVEPGGADHAWPSPHPAQRGIFSTHAPKPDLVCDISIPRDVGLAREMLIIFSLFLRDATGFVSSSRFRGSNVLVSPRRGAYLGSR